MAKGSSQKPRSEIIFGLWFKDLEKKKGKSKKKKGRREKEKKKEPHNCNFCMKQCHILFFVKGIQSWSLN